MSVYAIDGTVNDGHLTQTEVTEYGSSRLGIWNINTDVFAIAPVDFSSYSGNFIRGNKAFELSNHLGNVLTTISDKKIQHSTNSTTVDYYNADVVSANDYYPGGMQMPGRIFRNSISYKYGFNGQEKSNEVDEGGSLYTARYWQYDGRIVRRWNRDPKPHASLSDYQTFSNSPIWKTDPFGDTTILRNDGRILSNDGIGNGVYVHHFIDKSNHYIGELGGKIQADEIYGNLLVKNTKEAKGIWPLTFRDKVRTKGDWDLKNQKGTIWGLANDGKTKFVFAGKEMESQDIGNHHFGVVAKAAIWYIGEKSILMGAGSYQISSGTSKPEWQPVLKVTREQYIEHGMHQTVTELVRLPPYGDDPQDQKWITEGFLYYKTHN